MRLFVSFLFFQMILNMTSLGAVTFDWAIVGNPDNGADDTGYGAVDYAYRISKHEVTNAQYSKFLNSVDPLGVNSLGLYNPSMDLSALGGIALNLSAATGVKYQIKASYENNPVVFVSFIDAMRFVNWLENGQGNGSTESGVYTIANGKSEVRNSTARYFIPSENEWYKAAFHKNDGRTANYWDYATQSDILPYSAAPPGDGVPDITNVANHTYDDRIANSHSSGFAKTGSNVYDPSQNYLTNVGEYALSVSAYGTFDQGGNVYEWNEGNPGIIRAVRGGAWYDDSCSMWAPDRCDVDAFSESYGTGFRVAAIVPEPGAILLASSGFWLITWRRRTR